MSPTNPKLATLKHSVTCANHAPVQEPICSPQPWGPPSPFCWGTNPNGTSLCRHPFVARVCKPVVCRRGRETFSLCCPGSVPRATKKYQMFKSQRISHDCKSTTRVHTRTCKNHDQCRHPTFGALFGAPPAQKSPCAKSRYVPASLVIVLSRVPLAQPVPTTHALDLPLLRIPNLYSQFPLLSPLPPVHTAWRLGGSLPPFPLLSLLPPVKLPSQVSDRPLPIAIVLPQSLRYRPHPLKERQGDKETRRQGE